MDSDYSIQCLVGETLTDICFVMDYLQFGFSGSKLNSYSCPHSNSAVGIIVFPKKGARDALCSFIGHNVTIIEVTEEALTLRFDMGTIAIPLDSRSRTNGDAAEFHPTNNRPIIVF
jgi:hypothetical protein